MFVDLSLFRTNKNFRYLFVAQLISGFGSQMTVVTIPFQIYQLTQSMFLTGLVGSVELVALTLTVLYGGVLSDRYNRKKIMIFCEGVMIFFVALLAWNASLATPHLPLIFVGGAFLSALNGLHRPAVEALLPAIVKEEELVMVSSLAPMRSIITAVAGPSIAGLILAHAGAAWTYIIDGLTFFISILCMQMVLPPPLVQQGQKASSNFLAEVMEGFQYLKKRKDILGTYLIDFIAMVLVSPQVLMPHLAKTLAADSYLGLLYASPSIGALLSVTFSAWTKKVNRHGVAIALSALSWALCVGSVGVVSGIWFILFFLFLSGGFDMVSGIFRMTVWNKTIPMSIRGRMASFEMLSYMSGPLLGQLFIGAMADYFGYRKALIFGASVACVLMVVACWALPAFFQYRDKTPEA